MAHGMYETTVNKEANLINSAGIEDDDVELLQAYEYVLKKRDYFASLGVIDNSYVELKDEVKERKREILLKKLKEDLGIETLLEDGNKRKYTREMLLQEMANTFVNSKGEMKVPIIISGASKNKWETLSEDDKLKSAVAMQLLVDCIDPEKAYFITGGTNFGVEQQLHLANSLSEKKKDILGLFVLEAIDDLGKVEKNTITHAAIVRKGKNDLDVWQEVFPNFNAMIAKRFSGELIVISGGDVIKSIIEAAIKIGLAGKSVVIKGKDGVERNIYRKEDCNKYIDICENGDESEKKSIKIWIGGEQHDAITKVKAKQAFERHLHLMENVEGASKEKAKKYQGMGIGFKSYKVLLERIKENHGNDIFMEGVEIENSLTYIRSAMSKVLERFKGKKSFEASRKALENVRKSEINKAQKELIEVKDRCDDQSINEIEKNND